MANASFHDLPPLPEFTLHPLPPLFTSIPDKYLIVLLPVLAYWIVSIFFLIIDEYDLFPQYRLHTPAELLKRNHASRWDVLRDVVIQQLIQMVFAMGLAVIDPDPTCGKEQYEVAVWAQRIRITQRAVPAVLGYLGIDAAKLAVKYTENSSSFSSVLRGGLYPQYTQSLTIDGVGVVSSAFAPWELLVAKAIYWLMIPAVQFLVAGVILDTWQYFWHRGMHVNKWMYST